MGQRAYRRDSRGRFAGGGAGTKVTYGRAGGWANASHQAKAQAARSAARTRPPAGPTVRQRMSARAAQRRQNRQAKADAKKRAWNALTPGQKAKKIARRAAIAVAINESPRLLALGAVGVVSILAGRAAVHGGMVTAMSRGIEAARPLRAARRTLRGAYRITSL